MTDRLKAGLLAALLAMTVSVAPLAAFAGPAAAPSATTGAAAATAAPDDMPVTEMAWPTEDSGGMAMSHDKPKTFQGRVVAWLGVWHPAVIHFPIALVLTVGFLEAAAALRRKPALAASNRLLLGLATAGAFVAAPLGWISAGLPAPDNETALVVHRWIGTTLPFLILALWRLKPSVDQAVRTLGGRVYEGVLAVTVLLILVQSFFGAEVTHGAEHLRF